MPSQDQLQNYSEALDQASAAAGAMFPRVVESYYQIANGLITLLLNKGQSLDSTWRRKLERKYPTFEDKIYEIKKGGKMVAKKAKSLIGKRAADQLVTEDQVQPLLSAHLDVFGEDI